MGVLRGTRGHPLHPPLTDVSIGMYTLAAALAVIGQYAGYDDGRVTTAGLVFTLIGFLTLSAGGWLGGSLVFVHGMRVVGDEDTPPARGPSPTARSRPDRHA